MMRNIKSQKGFSLVEVLIAILVSSIVMGAIMLSFRTGLYSSVGIDAKVSAQQDVRAVLEMMALEIGMASYNPNSTLNIWRSTTGDCTAEATNQDLVRKGIQSATNNSITIQMDVNANGTIRTATDDQNEIITYTYDSANRRITRSTNCGNDFDILGCIDANSDGSCDNNSTLRSVRVINDANTPIFRYFNGNGTAFIPNMGLPTCVNEGAVNDHICNIRRIDITLVVESDIIDPMTKQRGKMIYSTSVILRNHAVTAF